jgi:hypothetical protein
MTTGEERQVFHEFYGDDPFNDERRVVRDGGSVRAPTFHLADEKDAESLRRRPAGPLPKGRLDRSMGI